MKSHSLNPGEGMGCSFDGLTGGTASEDRPCVFCEIARGAIPASVVCRSEDVVCFLPKEIEAYGHTLVVPVQHFETLYDIPEDVLCQVARASKRLAQAYKTRIGATGCTLIHASGKDAQQSVFHFHIHLVPRFRNDNLDTWPKLPEIDVDRDQLLRALRGRS